MNDADNGATSSIYRVVRSASGCSTPFAGKKNTGANFITTSANNPFRLTEPYCRVEQIVASLSRDTGNECNVVSVEYDDAKVIDIVVEQSVNIGVGEGNGIKIAENNNLAYGCIVSGCKTSGFEIATGGGEISGAVACTAIGNTVNGFFGGGGGGQFVFSCYAGNNGTDFTAGWEVGAGESDFNASGDASAPGNTTTAINVDYWDGGGDDAMDADHLLTASIDNGQNPVDNLSNTWNPGSFFTGPDALFGTSIEGNSRPGGVDATWDVGASEFVAAGTEVSAGLDTLVITEYAADVNLNVTVAAGLDTLVITEYNPTLNVGLNFTAGVDNLVITEYNPTVNAEVSFTAGLDTLVITEYGATVSLGVGITAGIDNLVITEYNPTVNAEVSFTAGLDTLVITEYDATVLLGEAVGLTRRGSSGLGFSFRSGWR